MYLVEWIQATFFADFVIEFNIDKLSSAWVIIRKWWDTFVTSKFDNRSQILTAWMRPLNVDSIREKACYCFVETNEHNLQIKRLEKFFATKAWPLSLPLLLCPVQCPSFWPCNLWKWPFASKVCRPDNCSSIDFYIFVCILFLGTPAIRSSRC